MIQVSRLMLLLCSVIWLGSPVRLRAAPNQLGDLDGDQIFTANDLARLVGHSAGTLPLPATLQPFADLNQDGFINDSDHDALVSLILESSTPQGLPLARIREVSPADGEGDVAVTRETILHFSLPLALNTALDTTQFYAEFGGRRILSRVDISSDKKKATLFYLEPLPSNARIRVTFDSTGVHDLLNRAIDGDADSLAGGTFTTTFDTLTITAVAGTAISGRVFASEQGQGANAATLDVPLVGVTVTVDGAEESLRAVTDAQGNFTLYPAPAGSFFVHVDGRTSSQSSYPNGNYYPAVGKRWEALAGRTDNLSGNSQDTSRGTIYLPKVIGAAMAAVSQNQDTAVAFPASVLADNPGLAGTELKVPANSLFADDGTRGGRIGIAPVAPDRLPSPLPPGLNLPMVITIQTDGATNFDRPVPITFPNLPDPITGQKLPPGAKSALWSFNHDLGDWEVVGPMTVSEDGLFVRTDAGVGVQQPGWHGTQPGTPGDGGEIDDDPPPDDDGNPLQITVEASDRQQDGKLVLIGDSITIVSNKTTTQWSVSQKVGQTTNESSGSQIKLTAASESTALDDVVVTASYTGKNGPESKSHSFSTIGPLVIGVDKNRDGIVSLLSEDETTSVSKHVFWANSDNDNARIRQATDLYPGDLGEEWADVKSAPSTVQGLADLEDFDRLVIAGKSILPALIRNGYELRLTDANQRSGTERIGITMTVTEDSTLAYLFAPSLAEEQITPLLSPTRDIAHLPLGDRAARSVRFGGARVTFLFEGAKIGESSIRLELIKNGGGLPVAFSNVVHLDIRSIEDFYDIYSVGRIGGGNGDNTTTRYHEISNNYARVSNELPAWDARRDDQYILFVHGWRMEKQGRRHFAETAFKRLFWLGYRGRVGLFSWPTDSTPRWQLPLYQKNYDRSERRAYVSASALRSLLANLDASHSNTCLLAHSMGNCVASEALRLEAEGGGRRIVGCYIASQAATVAHAYDPSLAEVNLGSALRNPEIPNVYSGFGIRNGTNPYFRSIDRSAHRIANFFNSQDDALDKWLINQFTKPDTVDVDGDDSILGAISGVYGYHAPSNRFFRRTYKLGPVESTTWLDELSDRYEILSHIAETRSNALGTTSTNLGPVTTNVDLGRPNFGGFGSDSDDHSGQFNRPLIRSRLYWSEVIRQAGF